MKQETTTVFSNAITMIFETISEESNNVILHRNRHNQIYEASSKLLLFFAECLRQDKQYFNLNPRPSKKTITNNNNKNIEVAICENDVFQMVCKEKHCAAAFSDTEGLDSDTEELASDTEKLDSDTEELKVGGKSKGLGAGVPGMSLSHTTSSTSKPVVSALGKRKSNKPNCFVSETKPLKKRTRTKKRRTRCLKRPDLQQESNPYRIQF